MDFTATHRLGSRAFMLFMLRHIRWPFIAALIVGALWFSHWQNLPAPYAVYAGYALEVLSIVCGVILLAAFLRAYVEYRSYEYRFEPEFFHIARGYIAREERGVVYHQIQTVTLRHGVVDRMVGVRYLVIVLNGNQYQPSEVVLPGLDRRKAALVQHELLRQARIHAPQYSAPQTANPNSIS